jgi:acid phosphatase type 7
VSITRRVGLPDPATVKAADQLQAQQGYDQAGIQPLPTPYAPGRATPESVGIVDPGEDLTFLVIGDHGGVSDPSPQDAVAAALAKETGCAFVYTVGDIAYFNADADQYAPQFYEPYAHVRLPFVGISGNHDSDTTDDPSRLPLDTFMANFCAKTPATPAADPQAEYGRDTQTQPSHDWALDLEAVTIIGCSDNAPSGGYLYSYQIEWLTQAVKGSRPDVPLIFAAHHPVYSVDAYHGGSAKMGAYLDGIFTAAGRYADMVLAGHVHDHQTFTRTLPNAGGTSKYIVQGNSGYYHRHAIAEDYTPGMDLGNGIVCDYADASQWGYLKLTVSGGKIGGEYVQVAKDGTVTPSAFMF